MRLCHRQIWGFSGGLLWCSTRISSISAAGLCTWYVCAPAPLGFLPESGGTAGGAGSGQSLSLPNPEGQMVQVAEVQSGGKSMLFILLVHKKQAGMVPLLYKISSIERKKYTCGCVQNY